MKNANNSDIYAVFNVLLQYVSLKYMRNYSYIKRNKEQPLTYITRLFDRDFNQLDFLRWKDYPSTEAVISACKELYANPVFKNKLKETAQFRIELLDGTTVYSSDNSIFIKKRSMKKPVKAVAEESKYTSK